MKMIERWEWIEEGMGIVLLSICRGHEFNDRFGIFNHMSVTVDDRMAFEWHKEVLLSPLHYMSLTTCTLSRPALRSHRKSFERAGFCEGEALIRCYLRSLRLRSHLPANILLFISEISEG